MASFVESGTKVLLLSRQGYVKSALTKNHLIEKMENNVVVSANDNNPYRR